VKLELSRGSYRRVTLLARLDDNFTKHYLVGNFTKRGNGDPPMTTYHISEDGNARPCKAEGRCPIGGEHFPTKLAAVAFVEAKELEAHGGGSFDTGLGRDQRYRLARSRVLPGMSYDTKVGELVYDAYGNEWRVENSSPSSVAGKPKLELMRARDGKLVTLDPKNEVPRFATKVEKDPDTGEYRMTTVTTYLSRKETGSWTVRDFYETTPEPVVLDRPPVRNSPKYRPLPEGVTELPNAALRHVNVHTSVDAPVSSRWLVIERSSTGELKTKEQAELTKAAYEQTGRDLSTYVELSEFQKTEYRTFDWKPLRVTNDGKTVKIEDLEGDAPVTMTGETVSVEDIYGYKLN